MESLVSQGINLIKNTLLKETVNIVSKPLNISYSSEPDCAEDINWDTVQMTYSKAKSQNDKHFLTDLGKHKFIQDLSVILTIPYD